MIHINKLKKSDIGRWVIYHRGDGSEYIERGKIKYWNGIWIFVVYNCDDDWENCPGIATAPRDLTFYKKYNKGEINE